MDSFRRGLIAAIAGYAIDHPGEKVEYGKVFPRHLERLKEAYFAEHTAQLQEIAEDILRLLANEEDHGLDHERTRLARSAYERLCERYKYEASSVRDALGELLARRYKD